MVLKRLSKALKKKNKGFTLVELIVVIVILAILIGVTIGGIYMYVGRSRAATDENNRSAVQATMSTIGGTEDIASYMNGTTHHYATMEWTKNGDHSVTINIKDGADKSFEKVCSDYAKKVFTDGLPSSKSGKKFVLGVDAGGENCVVKCVLLDNDLDDDTPEAEFSKKADETAFNSALGNSSTGSGSEDPENP